MTRTGAGCWRRLRARLLARLSEEASRGLVDPDLLDVLASLNSVPCVATVSSCSGRIVVVSAPLPGDKKRGGIVARWHRPVTLSELEDALRLAGDGIVWVSAQPLVLALYVYGLDAAERVVEVLVRAGLKYTGMRPAGGCPNTYYVLSMGTERLDVPVALRGRRIVGREELGLVVELLNLYLSLAKSKLEAVRRAAASLRVSLGCGDEATLEGAVTGTDLTERLAC